MSEAAAIIDGHHHIWRQKDLPWLAGPMLPRIFGPYEPIRRDYEIDDYLADIAGTGVVKSVYVQANWSPERAEDEVAYVQKAADETGWPHAIVGYANLLADDARPMLDSLAKYPLIRGIRMQLHWHEKAEYRYARHPDIADDAVFRRNLKAVGEHGFSFGVQVFDRQMEGAGRLADDFPEVTFVLTHAGMPEDLSDGGRIRWRRAITDLASRPNVVTSLSGAGTFIHRNDFDHVAWVVGETVAAFGTKRCLFGSNFPIEKIWTDYASLIAAYQRAVAGYTEEEQADLLHDTAARVYRLR